MAYRLPTFNLTCNVWRHSHPTSGPPDGSVQCQLRGAAKNVMTPASSTFDSQFYWELLVPALTDIRDITASTGSDRVEVPAGSSRFYNVVWADDVAKGFANEYRVCFITKRPPWPTPTP